MVEFAVNGNQALELILMMIKIYVMVDLRN